MNWGWFALSWCGLVAIFGVLVLVGFAESETYAEERIPIYELIKKAEEGSIESQVELPYCFCYSRGVFKQAQNYGTGLV